MVLTDTGLNEISLVMGNGGTIPSHIAIGTGSSTVTSGDTALLSETDRNTISEYDTSITKEITYIADFGTGEMSGTTLTEFGLFNSASGAKLYQRVVIGSQIFDGTNELQIQMTHRYTQ